jgi:aspartate-semialdehyde dehydrogenase
MSFAIGIIGATGVTGEVTLRVLEERSFPVRDLRLFASQRSAGQCIKWKGRDYTVEALDDGRFDGLDLVISATSASIAREWAPLMVEAGVIVIDQSSAFRLDPTVPLVVPEINKSDIETHTGIIAGPNCTTAVAVMAIAPLVTSHRHRLRYQLLVPIDLGRRAGRDRRVPRFLAEGRRPARGSARA